MNKLHSPSPDSVGAGAPAEIEITPEMIEAGLGWLYGRETVAMIIRTALASLVARRSGAS
jgi:hypothetical protein